MYNISTKSYRRLYFFAKIGFVFLALSFIYYKIIHLSDATIFRSNVFTIYHLSEWLALACFLTILNWSLEIVKWKLLIINIKKISFKEAFKQCLASLTISLITPNRIGEYPAKAIFYKSKNRRKIIVLNAIGNLTQLGTTLFFGVIGLLFVLFYFRDKFSGLFVKSKTIYLVIFSVLLFGLLLFLIKKYGRNYLEKSIQFVREIPKTVLIKIQGLSILRYLIFSHQYVLLLWIFGAHIDYLMAMPLVFLMYFISSVLPSFAMVDWAIKGGVGILLFSFINIDKEIVLTVAAIMWILNFAIPAIIGSYFVLKFNHNNLLKVTENNISQNKLSV